MASGDHCLGTGAARTSPRSTRHYHVIENTIGKPLGYRDDVFPSRRLAEAQARTRAEWMAAMAGLSVEALTGSGRYLITTHRPQDPGRLIEVEACDDRECMEAACGPMDGDRG
jgi:hypothetical protein